jgi:hypothetical protein
MDVPGAGPLAASRKLMREVFAGQLADRSLAGRQRLTEALVREANRAADNAVDRYVLLTAALQAAREAGDLATLVGVADELGGAYKVDPLSVKAELAGTTKARADSAAAAAANARAGIALADELLAHDEFGAATRVLQCVQAAAAAAAASPAIRAQHAERSKDATALKGAYDRAAQARAKLAAAPDDPAALLAVGAYACFVRGDWGAGLPQLARGSEPAVRAAAAADLRAGQGVTLEAAGDAWWAAAEHEPVGRFRRAMRSRARVRYEAALASGGVAGLALAKLEKRVEEAAAAEPAGAAAAAAGRVFQVPAGNQWVRTNFALVEGRCYEIVARGKWTDARGASVGPTGDAPEEFRTVFGPHARVPREAREQYFVGQSPRGALVACVEQDKPGFYVGDGQTFVAPASLTLSLRMNDGDDPSARRGGQVAVSVREVRPRFADARGETRIAARVDASDTLQFDADGLHWEYGGSWGRVGEHGGHYPTTINGVLWWPRWVDKKRTASLAETGLVPRTKLTLVRVEAARGDVEVESAGPGRAALRFTDKGGGSSVVGCVIATDGAGGAR